MVNSQRSPICKTLGVGVRQPRLHLLCLTQKVDTEGCVQKVDGWRSWLGSAGDAAAIHPDVGDIGGGSQANDLLEGAVAVINFGPHLQRRPWPVELHSQGIE